MIFRQSVNMTRSGLYHHVVFLYRHRAMNNNDRALAVKIALA